MVFCLVYSAAVYENYGILILIVEIPDIIAVEVNTSMKNVKGDSYLALVEKLAYEADAFIFTPYDKNLISSIRVHSIDKDD